MNNDEDKNQSQNEINNVQTNDQQFDPSHLKLSQNFSELVGVKKILTTIPTRKPGRQDFVRVHPAEEYRLETIVLELKDERETYLVAPELVSEIPNEVVPKVLYTTINRQGVLTLWPIRLPSEDGRHDTWNSSALEAAKLAQSKWIRVAANMSLGAYEVYEATGNIPEPDWPDYDFKTILKIAFSDKYIQDRNHAVLQRLRGEV